MKENEDRIVDGDLPVIVRVRGIEAGKLGGAGHEEELEGRDRVPDPDLTIPVHISPQQAVTGFGLECGEDDAARVAAVFAGPCPWMSDSF